MPDIRSLALIFSYIYLIQPREFINSNVYKVGKTKRESHKRLNQYPKGSKEIITIACNNCDILENEILKFFRGKYISRTDIGSEYFEGDMESMIHDICALRKSVNESIEDIKTTNVAINEAINELKILKEKDKLLTLKTKLLKAEKILKDKQKLLELESNDAKQNELQKITENEFKQWFDKNCKLDGYGKIALGIMVEKSKIDKEEVKNIMAHMNHKYQRDLSGLGKDDNGKYYKGGFIGISLL